MKTKHKKKPNAWDRLQKMMKTWQKNARPSWDPDRPIYVRAHFRAGRVDEDFRKLFRRKIRRTAS